jgi:hypothetical protein
MEDKRFPTETDPPEKSHREEMERELDELEQLVEEGNRLCGLPPIREMD